MLLTINSAKSHQRNWFCGDFCEDKFGRTQTPPVLERAILASAKLPRFCECQIWHEPNCLGSAKAHSSRCETASVLREPFLTSAKHPPVLLKPNLACLKFPWIFACSFPLSPNYSRHPAFRNRPPWTGARIRQRRSWTRDNGRTMVPSRSGTPPRSSSLQRQTHPCHREAP